MPQVLASQYNVQLWFCGWRVSVSTYADLLGDVMLFETKKGQDVELVSQCSLKLG